MLGALLLVRFAVAADHASLIASRSWSVFLDVGCVAALAACTALKRDSDNHRGVLALVAEPPALPAA